MEYGTTPVVAESNEEIYVNLLHGVAIGIISDILLDVCEYCIGCYSILWDIVDFVLGCYDIYWMLADIALGLSEKCLRKRNSIGFHWHCSLDSGRRFQRLLCCSEFTPRGGVNICHYEPRALLSIGTLGGVCIRSYTGFYWKRWEAIWRYFLQFGIISMRLSWRKYFWAEGSVSEDFKIHSWETFLMVSEWFQECEYERNVFGKFRDDFNEFGTSFECFWNELCDLK